MKESRKVIIFTDCGDTIIDEGTEIRKVEGEWSMRRTPFPEQRKRI